MSNEPLIGDLVAGLTPVRPRNPRSDWLLLGLLGMVELALLFVLGGTRTDLGPAIGLPSFWWKIASLGILTTVGVTTALGSFTPTGSPRRGVRVLAMLLTASLIAGWAIDAAGADGSGLAMRLMWREGIECVVSMALLSVPPLLALGALMRRGAPTDLAGSALAVGASSAAWGALVFSFHCPHDDPLYVAVWYSVGTIFIALLARLILPRFARW